METPETPPAEAETSIVSFPSSAATTPPPLAAFKRPIIILPSGAEEFGETAQHFFHLVAPTETLFLQGGRVVELEKDESGTFSLSIIESDAFRSIIERYGKPFAWRVGADGEPVLAPSRISKESATAWLKARERKLLPVINGLRNAPVLVDDGHKGANLLPKGYDPGTGLFITGGLELPIVTYKEAIDLLLNVLLGQFDFLTPSDKSRAVAAIVSPALKLGGLVEAYFPIFAVEADASQAGKGYLLELIQTIYREDPYKVTQKSGGVGGFDESLSQALVTGRAFIEFSNIRGRVGSQFLESVMTDKVSSARVPYRGEIQVDPRRFIFQLTSNGFETTADLANRSCIIRIKKRPRKFAFRRFAGKNLLEHVTANQPLFLSAVYAIVRKWVKEGKLISDDLRGQGRFRDWAQVNDQIVQDMGLPPLLDGHERAQEGASNPGTVWLRKLAIVIVEQDRLDERLNASELADISVEAGLDIPGATNDEKRKMVIGSVMKNLFEGEGEETIEIEGGVGVRRFKSEETKPGHGSFIAIRYRFEKKDENP